ncbi:putative bifunctional diguanylate cyclase/phosphodiesterase [Thiohalorhabdus denitrificans]|uniref:Diguanylate cyclase (GGDEF) domain-containing protein n=1 Tax=Thiohalorhabdus denitrificans TaxID=381306 RepID=A0A1G5AGG4_9GAMM|nr:EAL domain-containing protein [Thiohalorhabdus denitrificans]SCX76988.1 diguanylate cyclase (GGDEF) domain-containing protein [Thiohalorhabdus denitrificans]
MPPRVPAFSPPELNSLHGRYLLGALLVLAVLLASSWFAEAYLHDQQSLRTEHFRQRQEALEVSRMLQNAFWEAEHYLQAFALTPDEESRARALEAIQRAQEGAARLRGLPWVARNHWEPPARALDRAFEALEGEARSLIAIRTSPDRMYPALRIMRDELGPASRAFLNAAQLALASDASRTAGPLGRVADGDVAEVLHHCRYQWSRMIAEFRLYMTARMGMLGGDEDETRARNVESFFLGVSESLAELEERAARGTLPLAQQRAVVAMREQAGRWYDAYERVRSVYLHHNWREDFPLITGSLHPLYQSIQSSLIRLDKRLADSANRATDSMATVASHLTAMLWGLLVIHLGVVVLGYAFLNRGILAPLARVAGAIKREAEGGSGAPALPRGPREIEDVVHAFGVMREEVRSRESDLQHQAFHDPLTDLPNRPLLEDRLTQAIQRARRKGLAGALVMLDLDFFKEINDTFGHPTGDRVLVEVAQRLRQVLRDTDTVARFGGDEFGILLPDTDGDAAKHVAGKLLARLQAPLSSGNGDLHIGASMGITLFPEHGEDPETLIRRADLAMYEAKRLRQGFVEFHSDHHPDTVERLTRVNDLFEDIRQDRIPVHFQPQMDLASGRTASAEALLRWGPAGTHPLPPQDVFGMAERAGVLHALTRRVLNASVRECARWHLRGYDLGIAVNLSADDLQETGMVEEIRNFLTAWDLPAHRLELEITENAMVADAERAKRILGDLRALGVRIAVDDYGTGYSALGYLKELPVDTLKIDKSFVMRLHQDPEDQAIVRSTIDLGHSLGLQVVAEGVEDGEALHLLRQWGCDRAQGFHLGAPLPSGDWTG